VLWNNYNSAFLDLLNNMSIRTCNLLNTAGDLVKRTWLP